MAAHPSDELEAERIWGSTIRELLTAASSHPLDQRFASPERWPGYYLVRQRAIASAVRSECSARRGVLLAEPVGSAAGTEKLLTGCGGLLVGRPDQFDHQSVTEYKSGLPDPDWPEAASIVEGYWRQLRLYAVLVAEVAGWPIAARIVAASGQVLEQSMEKRDCESEAAAAVAGLQAMNQALERGCSSRELASPGEIACEQCQYQAICPTFWSWCEAESWPQLREPAARGTIMSIDNGVDRDLYAITLALDGRHGEGGPLTLALRRSVHGDLTTCRRGAQIRIVRAHVRRDGRLRADMSTCVFSEDELPELELESSA